MSHEVGALDRDGYRACPISYAEFRHLYLPYWSKDNESNQCMNCVLTFHVFRRRHHCRICGRIFCASCSSKAVEKTRFVKSVRVCDDCHHRFTEDRPLQGAQSNKFRQPEVANISNGAHWIPDEWAPYCMCCAEVFNRFRKREHCRKCGQVVCRKCSSTRRRVERFGFVEPVPVCIRCVVKLNAFETTAV